MHVWFVAVEMLAILACLQLQGIFYKANDNYLRMVSFKKSLLKKKRLRTLNELNEMALAMKYFKGIVKPSGNRLVFCLRLFQMPPQSTCI